MLIAESEYMTCIHQESGLCPECQAEWEADPSAWIEYGNHPRGIANWQRTQAEIAEGTVRG